MPTIDDLFAKGSNGTAPEPTTLASQKAEGASSLSLNAAVGWPTDTPVHFLLYETDAQSKLVSGSVSIWKGILSGTTVSDLVLRGGTDTNYPANSPVQLQFTSAQQDDMVAGIQESLNPDGTIQDNVPLNAPILTSPTTKGLITGWIGANESWSYASASTITVPTDATAKYDVGDYLQLTQSATVKYFVITALTSTVLTVIGLNGETVANVTISANSYFKRYPLGAAPYEKPHYNCLFFSVDSGTVFTNSEVTVPFDVSDTTNGFGITATTGANAALTITRSSFYDIQFRFTCIDNAASNFIAWIFINDTSSVYGIRRQDQSIGVNQGDTYELKSVFLPAGSSVYAQHYNGGGATRFGTNNVSGSSSAAIRRLYESLTVMEVR